VVNNPLLPVPFGRLPGSPKLGVMQHSEVVAADVTIWAQFAQ